MHTTSLWKLPHLRSSRHAPRRRVQGLLSDSPPLDARLKSGTRLSTHLTRISAERDKHHLFFDKCICKPMRKAIRECLLYMMCVCACVRACGGVKGGIYKCARSTIKADNNFTAYKHQWRTSSHMTCWAYPQPASFLRPTYARASGLPSAPYTI